MKLQKVVEDLRSIGLPAIEENDDVIYHSAMVLSYSEKHEQSKWVAHMILPDIEYGNVSRTNDFREDPLVKTGTAVKADYWYSGFDRGHLAPSADFKWSAKALSESYFYSNMAPQRPELNRERWAQLEGFLRRYVIEHKEPVYVVTGGVLKDDLPSMQNKGHKNEVSIPELFYKVVLDYSGDEKKGLAFLMPNGECEYPVIAYAVSIDSVEALTGIDFFPALPDEEEDLLESTYDVKLWQTGKEKGDYPPIPVSELPKKSYNTVQAKMFIGDKVTICGTVVSTKYHEKSGATFINLDKKFPNQVFSVNIWKDNRVNFSYKPEEELMHRKICVQGKLRDYKGTPAMDISHERQVKFLDDPEDFE
ncbi:MAG: DNA/RNA non-specific endonuclease [Marinilabiliales bacterium]|nr:MAG: DNA/RNA non-specific endonuclease [Marinilabiliales bacterium]